LPEDLHARVLALDARSEPPVALAETSAGRSLIVSTDGGSAWQAVPLDDVATRVAEGNAPLVASQGDVVAIADPQRGIAISSDAGKSFARIGAGGLATALAVGELDGVVGIFCALYRETEDRTFIARIDLGEKRAEVIAEIEAPASDETADGAQVTALAWDASGRRLLAAGGLGLVEIAPPSAS
jgi:hypothetical protein